MYRILRANLTQHHLGQESLSEQVCREYVGGAGIGVKILYDEVPPAVNWSDEENRLIFATGPLNGTSVPGSGTICAVTKGCLTNGCSSSQANGFFGAFLRTAGVDGLVIEGRSNDWVYLYIHDGTAEIRDARHLVGKDTVECEGLVKQELRKKPEHISVYAIGPAGENKVNYAMIFGDRGHVIAHNGFGAVMGEKKLKAIAVERGKVRPPVRDARGLAQLSKEIGEQAKKHPIYGRIHEFGTSMLWPMLTKIGLIPVKNLTTNHFPDYEKFSREYYGSMYDMKPFHCWACPLDHVQRIRIERGKNKALETKDPEFECTAAWSSLIGNQDFESAVVLSDLADRLGLDSNEAGWTVAFAMECFERGILTKADTDGLALTWGNVETATEVLYKIARREGVGNILADGVKRAAEHIGGKALALGVYVNKGHSPRTHDARGRWCDILDYATGNVGTVESNAVQVPDPFLPKNTALSVVKGKIRQFVDSLVVCNIATMSYSGDDVKSMVKALSLVTGWDYTDEEAVRMSLRVTNLARVFNLKAGIVPDLEVPSERYGSTPEDGPVKGVGIMIHWQEMVDEYYKMMGWDRLTGKPLPETLEKLGLSSVIADIW